MDKLKDSDLREALRRKYVKTPPVPADFEENIMNRIMKDWDETSDTISPKRNIPLASDGEKDGVWGWNIQIIRIK